MHGAPYCGYGYVSLRFGGGGEGGGVDVVRKMGTNTTTIYLVGHVLLASAYIVTSSKIPDPVSYKLEITILKKFSRFNPLKTQSNGCSPSRPFTALV